MLDAIEHITETDDNFFASRKTVHWCTCIVHATQSNCCGDLDFLSPEPWPNSPELNALVTRFRESYSSVSMNHKSKRLKKSSSDCMVEFWQCTNTAFEWKIRFLCFPVLPGSAEAQVTWGGTVKHLLIAYFISKISAKKISKCVHVCQSYGNQRRDVLYMYVCMFFFETQCTTSLINFLHFIQSIASSFHICQIWQSFSITSLQVFFGLPPDFTPSTS